MRAFLWAWCMSLLFSSYAVATEATSGDVIAVQDLHLTVPDGWRLRQDARDDGRIILGFEKGTEYVTIFVSQDQVDMHAMFANGSTIVRDVRTVPRQGLNWQMLETSKTYSSPTKTAYVASFAAEHQGYSYYGYSRGTSSTNALDDATQFLQNLR